MNWLLEDSQIKYVIDASVWITAWNVYYPHKIFPSLWKQLHSKNDSFVLIKDIYNEISHDDKDNENSIKKWIDEKITPVKLDKSANEMAVELQKEYEPKRDSEGVSEADLHLIAYAKCHNYIVCTQEGKQMQPPKMKSNYKIPLVCKTEDVQCIDLPKLIIELEFDPI